MPKRALQILAIFVFAITMLGADSSSTRAEKVGHKLVCQCGCSQILLECNHVGCPTSPGMIDELHAQVAAGLPESGVLKFFIAKYGPIVLAAPMRGGFDNVAWIVPIVALVLCLLGVVLLLRVWRRRAVAPLSAAAETPRGADTLRDRIREETDNDHWSGK